MTDLKELPAEIQLATAQHVKYIQSLDARKEEYDYWLTEHLRLNGLYWGLTALHLLRRPDALPRDETAQMEPLVSFQLRAVAGRPHLMPVDSHL